MVVARVTRAFILFLFFLLFILSLLFSCFVVLTIPTHILGSLESSMPFCRPAPFAPRGPYETTQPFFAHTPDAHYNFPSFPQHLFPLCVFSFILMDFMSLKVLGKSPSGFKREFVFFFLFFLGGKAIINKILIPGNKEKRLSPFNFWVFGPSHIARRGGCDCCAIFRLTVYEKGKIQRELS